MVKRTLVVLGILSLMLTAGTSFAFFGGCGSAGPWGFNCGATCPLFVGVDCPPTMDFRTVVKTWEAKVIGPCPPAGPGYGVGCGFRSRGCGILGGLCAAIPTPLDWLFGGCDGVYGCLPRRGGGPCGPCFGPIPAAMACVPRILSAPTMFGALW